MPSARRTHHLNTIEVADLADPGLDGLLAPYRNQKDAWLRVQQHGGTGFDDGLFMAEGELVVRALVESRHRVVSVLCTPTRLAAMGDALGSLPPETPVLAAERGVIEQILGFDMHRGVLALGQRVDPPTADDLIAKARLLVVCEDLANHDNTGAVFRNTACLAWPGGVPDDRLSAAVLLSPGCCDPLYRKSLRVSMGHALRLPFARLEPWPNGVDRLERAGFTTLALTPHPTAIDIRDIKHTPNTKLAVLLGAEGPGLTGDVMARATVRARIPMAAGADSLNVATALAVVLSHFAVGS
jgi:tRNA G18 (ribose-2'-O)-methylase SpoU